MPRPSSFRASVNLRGKPCSWTRHFRGCARTLVGYLQKLAANDPERFCWPSPSDLAAHATDWSRDQRGRELFSERQVRRALRLLERLGILLAARRNRNHRERSGWVVTRHATSAEAKRCAVPSITITYRSNRKCQEVPPPNVSGGEGFVPGNVSAAQGFVSAFVSAKEGFVSGESAECVRECVRSQKPEVTEIQDVNLDSRRASSQVSHDLTFNEPNEPVFLLLKSEAKRTESITASSDGALSYQQNLKAEEPDKTRAFLRYICRPILADQPPHRVLASRGQIYPHARHRKPSCFIDLRQQLGPVVRTHVP